MTILTRKMSIAYKPFHIRTYNVIYVVISTRSSQLYTNCQNSNLIVYSICILLDIIDVSV